MRNYSKFPAYPVLIVDDESFASQGMDIALRSGGVANTVQCNDSRNVKDLMSKQHYECIVLDLSMPYLGGEQILSFVMSEHADVPVIIATGNDELETAVRCMKAGAFDYMLKPVSKERLVSAVKRAIELRELRRENNELKEHVLSGALECPDAFRAFDTGNAKMLSVFRYVESIARSPEPVLITGETGVGKEIMAACVAKICGLEGAYVPVNVAGLDDTAFSDTLFGHRKGAFTGAVDVRLGLIDKAQGGVLFLDEIGDLNLAMQVKLLRLLQEREYFPLGSDAAKVSTARIIVATNKSVEELQKSEHFRADLFFRLRRHHVHIPPLRERLDDVPLLFNSILDRVAAKLEIKRPYVPKEVFTALAGYSFPGNVRELESMIHDACAGCRGGKMSVTFFHDWIQRRQGGLPGPAAQGAADTAAAFAPPSPLTFPGGLPTLKEAQTLLVNEAMKRAKGNQSIAARMLGVTRQALNKRLLKQED